MKLSSTLVLSSIACFSNVNAQIASDGSLPGKNKFDKVEINTKLPNENEMRQRALVATRIFGREELDRFTNLSDALSNLPGVVIVNGAAALSGMNPKYTKLLINGDPAPVGWTIEQIEPNLVERIEITRSQTANRSSQAVGGTINIVFKSVPRKIEQTLRIGANYQNERPSPTGTFTTSGKSGDFSYSLPFSLNELLQTYRVNSLRSSIAIDESRVVSAGYEEMYWRYNYISPSFNPRFEYTINADEKLTSQSFFQTITRYLNHRFDRTVLSGNPASEADMDRETNYSLVRSNLKWSKNVSAQDRIEATAALSRVNESDQVQTSRTGVAQYRRDSDIIDMTQTASMSYTRVLNDQHVISTGIDFDSRVKDSSSLNTYLLNSINPDVGRRPFRASSTTKAAYVQDEWEVDSKLALNFGLRAESITLSVDVPDIVFSRPVSTKGASNTFSIVSPSIFLSYKPDPTKKNTLRAGFSRAYKAPGIADLNLIPIINRNAPDTSKTNSELFSDGVGTSTLKPELATSFDLSYDTYFNSLASLTVGSFFRDITDLTAEVTTLQNVPWASAPRWVSQPRNFSHGISYGVEMEMRADASAVLPANVIAKDILNVRLNVNLYGSRVDALQGPDNRLGAQYPWTITLGMDYKPTSKLTLGATAFASPFFKRRASEREIYEQSNLDWVNAFAQYRFDNKSSLRLGVNNAFPSTNRYSGFSNEALSVQNRSGRTGLTITYDTKL